MKSKVTIFIISFLLITVCIFSGCDFISLLSKDENFDYNQILKNSTSKEESPTQGYNGKYYGRSIIRADIGETVALIPDKQFFTLNSAKLCKNFEDTGYDLNSEYLVRDITVDNNSDVYYLLIDGTFKSIDESFKGELLKPDIVLPERYFSLNSKIEITTSVTSDINGEWEVDWSRFDYDTVIFDYDVVNGGERYTGSEVLKFDVIEGQDFNFRAVYPITKSNIREHLYVTVTNILDSNATYDVYVIEVDKSIGG